MSVTCAAILCVRNEAAHIQRAVGNFVNQGIDVVVIDHGSTDNTVNICEQFKGHGLLSIEYMPWTGTFDLVTQLEVKRKISEALNHDWIIHADADEWFQSSVQGECLLEGINRLSSSGFNVINFEEFVFLPFRGQEIDVTDYEKQIMTYYYFAPSHLRLMRAWKRSSNFQNSTTGGHRLLGESVNIAEETFVLKHYLVLSHEHAIKKYVGRVFSEDDLRKGMHGNRLNLTAQKLQLPLKAKLKVQSCWDKVEFDRSDAKTTHFWEW
jgi:glycosyltransferase involved in cell wall biosynthesis